MGGRLAHHARGWCFSLPKWPCRVHSSRVLDYIGRCVRHLAIDRLPGAAVLSSRSVARGLDRADGEIAIVSTLFADSVGSQTAGQFDIDQ